MTVRALWVVVVVALVTLLVGVGLSAEVSSPELGAMSLEARFTPPVTTGFAAPPRAMRVPATTSTLPIVDVGRGVYWVDCAAAAEAGLSLPVCEFPGCPIVARVSVPPTVVVVSVPSPPSCPAAVAAGQ